MSLSANDNSASYPRLPPSGKTPPPAPSAAYAKRARELQSAENLAAAAGPPRYLPPARRALVAAAAAGGSPSNEAPSSLGSAVDGSAMPPSNYPQPIRRARAGTLPSNVHLAAQRFAAASNTLGTTTPSTDSLLDQIPRQAALPQVSSLAPARPGLRHATTVAPTIGTTSHSRIRSGSLTLPSAGLSSNAFGSSLFGSSWLPSANTSSSGFPILDELRSVTSADSGIDDFDVHTLDYLGLDDSLRPAPSVPAATISEVRNQAQGLIVGNLNNPARMRASTVSNPYRNRPAVTNSLLSHHDAEEEDEYLNGYDENAYNRRLGGGYDPGLVDGAFASGYLTANKNLKTNDHLVVPTRPRAISVGNLDDPMRGIPQRRNTLVEPPHSYLNDLSHQTSNLNMMGNNLTNSMANNMLNNMLNPTGILKNENKLAPPRTGSSPTVHFPNTEIPNRGPSYLVAPNTQQNRSISPKSEVNTAQIQTPSRSLWIGNLDSSVTSDQLIHIFAPYGAIESLRLLPEKECGFVNFVDQADAIRAKEDVLNRLGGNIGMPNGQTVRIGFGKADSAPVAPAKGATTNTGSSSPVNQPGKTATTSSTSNNGMDAQLQSTPTRALWIGSIPSTTTPATILSVFSPYGPIESARVLTHKNCGFINFERLDDAVRARKALNGRDVLGSDVGAIRIGFAKVPVKNGQESNGNADEMTNIAQGVGDLSVGATIHALRTVKGASTIPADQQVLGGNVENYRSNLLLSMIASGAHTQGYTGDGLAKTSSYAPSITEQQMIMRELAGGSPDAEVDIQVLSDFRPPTMYYTTIPLVSERQNNRRWDASKLRELRKRLDSGTMSVDEIDQVAADFLDGEIVDLASDWLGNTVVQKLFERCSSVPRFAMLERLAPHLAMIGIHKNGTWAAQKIIECVTIPEEISLIAQNLRAYAPPLLLDQFGNYVVQCCLRFGAPANDFIFDAIVDRMWEVAQGRFGARSMRACLESSHITISQQRRIATAVILNSIPLATNPNGALLLTWLLDTSGFSSRYKLLAPRFTPHLSHLCTHKLASLTVLRIVNQKIEPGASREIVDALFNTPGDHVLADVLGDQVNGVAVVHKILTSPFVDPLEKHNYVEATKRVLIELKVIATQAYRRLIEEVGLPVPNYQPNYTNTNNPSQPQPGPKSKPQQQSNFGVPGLPQGYPSNDQGLASMMAALQMGGQNPQAGPTPMPVDSSYNTVNHNINPQGRRSNNNHNANVQNSYSPVNDPFNPFGMRTPEATTPRSAMRRAALPPTGPPLAMAPNNSYVTPSANIPQGNNMMGMGQPSYSGIGTPNIPPQMYQAYMYPPYQQNPGPNMGGYPN